ncbi:MAG TPA: hypothetical protein VGN23_16720 [Verrucomicrobiae bacterium]|jgi:hypothetical protein
MKINDVEVQCHYDRTISVMKDIPENLLPIFGLMDAYGWFKLTEGQDSARVREITRLLTSPELRGALKTWYLRHDKMNAAAEEFRHVLERLIGEKLPLGIK